MSEFRGVTPPNSVEAEQSVLGAMMQDENAVLQAAEALSTDDFYQPAHREIFEAMVALHHQQRPIDLVTVDAELTRRGTLEGIGGTEYLMRLMSFVPTTANVKAYITLVAENRPCASSSRRRRRFRRSVTASRIPCRRRSDTRKRRFSTS